MTRLMRSNPLAGLTSGVALVLAGLVAVALTLGAPDAARADAKGACAPAHHLGYGEAVTQICR